MKLDIAIVDDSKLVHAMILQTLEMAEIEINQHFDAMNGREGLELLRNHKVDLVITDIHMPVMDGVEMIRAIRNDEALQDLPVIVISSESGQKRIEELKELNVKFFIQKPFTPEAVREAIEQVKGESYV